MASDFLKGQTWPTEKPFELILQASTNNQNIFEIIIGETEKQRKYDVIFENGYPKLAEFQKEEEIIQWGGKPARVVLKENCQLGKDSLKLLFRINKNADLYVSYFDINNNNLGEINLGNIF